MLQLVSGVSLNEFQSVNENKYVDTGMGRERGLYCFQKPRVWKSIGSVLAYEGGETGSLARVAGRIAMWDREKFSCLAHCFCAAVQATSPEGSYVL